MVSAAAGSGLGRPAPGRNNCLPPPGSGRRRGKSLVLSGDVRVPFCPGFRDLPQLTCKMVLFFLAVRSEAGDRLSQGACFPCEAFPQIVPHPRDLFPIVIA